MDWNQYLAVLEVGGPGLAALVDKARESAGGGSLTATRLLHDPDELAELARQVEDGCKGSGATLLAGLERAERLGSQQRERFARLVLTGATAVMFGVGVPERLPPGAVWVELPPRSSGLESQWFLVTEQPAPIALMRFRVGARRPPAGLGRQDDGRGMAAFVSRDGRLVEAIIRTLRKVASRSGVTF